MISLLKEFRTRYREMQETLPFLDCYISDMPPFWSDVPAEPPTAFEKLSFTEGSPRLVLQTKHSFDEIAAMAAAEPDVDFIIASGDRKLLYHIAEITRLLKDVPNKLYRRHILRGRIYTYRRGRGNICRLTPGPCRLPARGSAAPSCQSRHP